MLTLQVAAGEPVIFTELAAIDLVRRMQGLVDLATGDEVWAMTQWHPPEQSLSIFWWGLLFSPLGRVVRLIELAGAQSGGECGPLGCGEPQDRAGLVFAVADGAVTAGQPGDFDAGVTGPASA